MENSIRLIWQCEYCNDVVISYSHLRHEMNWCQCGKSAVDLEDGYQRVTGKVKDVSKKKRVDGKWMTLYNTNINTCRCGFCVKEKEG